MIFVKNYFGNEKIDVDKSVDRLATVDIQQNFLRLLIGPSVTVQSFLNAVRRIDNLFIKSRSC